MTGTADSSPLKIPGLPEEELNAAQSSDSKSKNEADILGKGLSENEIREKALQDEYERGKAFKDNFEKIAIFGMRVGATALFLTGSTWLWHLLAPSCWRWLDKDDVSTLQNLFTGGILISAFADHFRKRVG